MDVLLVQVLFFFSDFAQTPKALITSGNYWRVDIGTVWGLSVTFVKPSFWVSVALDYLLDPSLANAKLTVAIRSCLLYALTLSP